MPTLPYTAARSTSYQCSAGTVRCVHVKEWMRRIEISGCMRCYSGYERRMIAEDVREPEVTNVCGMKTNTKGHSSDQHVGLPYKSGVRLGVPCAKMSQPARPINIANQYTCVYVTEQCRQVVLATVRPGEDLPHPRPAVIALCSFCVLLAIIMLAKQCMARALLSKTALLLTAALIAIGPRPVRCSCTRHCRACPVLPC